MNLKFNNNPFLTSGAVIVTLFCISIFFSFSVSASDTDGYLSRPEFDVDRVLSRMTTREKIAQLFIVAFSSDPEDKSTKEAIDLIRKDGIGGVIIMNTDLTPGVRMINQLQSISEIPLLVTIDGEWGPSMRFDSVMHYPRQMQLGALSSDSLIFKMGFLIGKQLKRLGVHLNYAPTIDINNNPRNPVINTRSFGEDKEKVSSYGIAYYRGMESAGVPGCAKHFPGHGDTDSDSHHELPLILHSRERLDSLELYPFKRMIEKGVQMIMVGHLQIPSLDSSGRPSSVSFPIVSDLLRRDLEFGGMIITDALNMEGVKAFKEPEYLPLEAYKAGSDILLMPENPGKALDIMEKAVKSGEISMHSLNVRARKMLALKDKLGIMNHVDYVDEHNVFENLNSSDYKAIISELSHKSVTLISNKNDNLPLKDIRDKKIGYLSFGGDENGKVLAEMLLSYARTDTIILRKEVLSVDTLESALNAMSGNDYVIMAIHDTDARPQKEFGIDEEYYKIITAFARNNNVSLIYFGNPLALSLMSEHDNFKSVIIGYQNTYFNNIAAGHIVYGASGATGVLPVSAGGYSSGISVTTEGDLRPRYGIPDKLYGCYDQLVYAVDSLINKDIENERYANAQLILMDKGDIIFMNSYGNADNSTLLKLGRIEGIMAMVPSIMKLRQEGYLSLEDIYNNHLISDILMHRVTRDGSLSDEPVYSEINDMAIKSLISKKTGVSYFEYAHNIFWNDMGIYNVDFIEGNSLNSNANEIAKMLSMIYNDGYYGGIKIMDSEASVYTSLFLHYYSGGLNGSRVWTDKENRRAVIFLNDGAENHETKLQTADVIRRALLNYFKAGESFPLKR